MTLVLAYLDPSTGSMAYQVAISGVLAVLAACRLYWRQVKNFLGGKREDSSNGPA